MIVSLSCTVVLEILRSCRNVSKPTNGNSEKYQYCMRRVGICWEDPNTAESLKRFSTLEIQIGKKLHNFMFRIAEMF